MLDDTLIPAAPVVDPNAPEAVEPAVPENPNKKRNNRFKQQIEACKQYRRSLVRDWQTNVDYRRGKPFPSQSDEDRIVVNLDWSLTKQKHAALFSTMPQCHVNHPPETIDPQAPWAFKFEQRLNDTALKAGVESAMHELIPDCINAAGIGICMIYRDVITKDTEVSVQPLDSFPPEQHAEIVANKMLPDGTPIETTIVPVPIDSRYVAQRISPADGLWPLNFTGSDFDKAPWLGRSGRIPWAAGKRRFKLKDEDKQKVTGESRTTLDRIDRIAYEDDRDNSVENDEMVSFDEIFFRMSEYDENAKSFNQIWHLVFVHGKQEAVIDEEWKGQKFEQDKLVGAQRYPIQFLTLTYITDDAIPPSDSAIGRPQVNETNKSRTQMNLQRQHSLPVKWVDPNRVDPLILHSLMRGGWQHFVPIVGGATAIGEVARAQMPQENFAIDRIIKDDLNTSWGTGGMEAFGQNVETKAETQAIGASVATRMGQERAQVAKFFINLMEVLGGLLSIYEEPESFGEGFSPLVSQGLCYSILADSTVLLDSEQRLKKLIQFINYTAKSGFINIEPVVREIAALSGLDPSVVVQPPQPKPPAEPNLSLRFTGAEDLRDPMALAFFINTKQAPSMQQIQQAKVLISAGSITPDLAPNVTGPDEGPPEMGPDGQPLPPHEPEMPPPPVGEANPSWATMGTLDKRSDGGQN